VYDPKAESKEFAASSRDEAIAKAVSFFGVASADELAVGQPEGDVAGLAGRALIVARSKNAPAPARPRGGDRERERERDDDRGGEPRGRNRRDRGGRRERSEPREERSAAPEPASVAPSAPSVGTAKGDLDEVGQFLLGTVERMDVGPFEIEQSEEADYVILQLSGEAADRIGSGEGRTADALQLLVNQAAHRIHEEPKRIVIDAGGDSDSREVFLSRVAGKAAKRARDTGRSVALEAMSPADRRLVHVALRDDDGIATMSVGEGRYRQVLVVPEGAPEFDEASSYGVGNEAE
jgi:spoIIIJ-associated protein